MSVSIIRSIKTSLRLQTTLFLFLVLTSSVPVSPVAVPVLSGAEEGFLTYGGATQVMLSSFRFSNRFLHRRSFVFFSPVVMETSRPALVGHLHPGHPGAHPEPCINTLRSVRRGTHETGSSDWSQTSSGFPHRGKPEQEALRRVFASLCGVSVVLEQSHHKVCLLGAPIQRRWPSCAGLGSHFLIYKNGN